ncbi:MAG: T9SS type A sorting domain-containing protein [Bacteroidetes bacterium]|nr:T9SS type A sorting domain-containing protein [Bacteroidota bacterium]
MKKCFLFIGLPVLLITLCNTVYSQTQKITPSGPESQEFVISPTVVDKATKENTSVKLIPTTKSATTSSFSDAPDIRILPTTHMQASPNICINKKDPNNIVVTSEALISTFNWGTAYYYSTNGGTTWNGSENLSSDHGRPNPSFDAANKAFNGSDFGNTFIRMQSSNNGGATWGNLVDVYGDITATPIVQHSAADNEPLSPYSGNVYSAWSMQNHISGLSTHILFARSTDHGLTFTSPVTLKPIGNGGGTGANVQTGPNGEVYVCWNDRDWWDNPLPYKGVGFCRSLDGGVTFTPYTRIANYTGVRTAIAPDPAFNNTIVEGHPTMAVDKSLNAHRGRIYLCSNVKENNTGKAIVQVCFSDDKGNSWSQPLTVSIPQGLQNFNPRIAVDDCSGDIWVVYYSFDGASGFDTNTYLAHSSDGGITWENQKVSDVSHVTAPINNNQFATGYAGWYIGVAAYQGKVYPVWSDNRSGNWQLYCSPITTTPCTPPAAIWPKVYSYARMPFALIKDLSGNYCVKFGGVSGTFQQINHQGNFPPSTDAFDDISFHYNSSGVTNWYIEHILSNPSVTPVYKDPCFASSDGNLQWTGYPNDVYTNLSSGLPSSGPGAIPSPTGQVLVAEVNPNEFIIKGAGSVTVYISNVATSTINGIDPAITKFNPLTNHLFVLSKTQNQLLVNVYSLSGGILTPIPANPISGTSPSFIQVDNSDKIYYVDNNVLNQYDYTNTVNPSTPVVIPNFTNSNIYGLYSNNPNTEDRCLVVNKVEERIYSLDFTSLTSKHLSAFNLPYNSIDPSSQYLGYNFYYAYEGNYVYIAGATKYGVGTSDLQIGTQLIPALSTNGHSVFFTKLDITQDFTFRMATNPIASSLPVGLNHESSIISATSTSDFIISPNPVGNMLKLTINDSLIAAHKVVEVKIYDSRGSLIKQISQTSSIFSISTDNLKPGLYFISFKSQNGTTYTKSFLKN